MKKLLAILLVLTLAVTCLIGVTPAMAESKKLTIALSFRNAENSYNAQSQQAIQLAIDYIKTIDPELEIDFQVLACEGSDNTQIEQIRALCASAAPNMILLVNPNSTAITASIAEVCEEYGVYWGDAWNAAEGVYPTDYKYYVFHNSPLQTGVTTTMMSAAFDAIGGEGNVLAVKGMESNTASIERYQGLMDALEKYPNITLMDTQIGDFNPIKAQEIVTTWLTKYDPEDIDVIWSANDEMALAIVEVLKANGLNGKILVTGFDGSSDALDCIKAGDLFATCDSNPWYQFGLPTMYLYEAWKGDIDVAAMGPEYRAYYTEAVLVTGENVEEWYENHVTNLPVLDFANWKDISFGGAIPMTW